jgi:hypothetical protein
VKAVIKTPSSGGTAMKSNIRTFALATLVAVAVTACPHCAFATSTTPPPPPPVCKGTHFPTVTIEFVLSAVLLPVLLP